MRKLATIRTIHHIKPIDGADAIECAVVDGWEVVVKKDQFKEGDMVVYLEVDSFIPKGSVPIELKGSPQEYDGALGHRLKTVKLRGQISQGLILPTSILPEGIRAVGTDVTELLGIRKWEPTTPVSLAGEARGLFVSDIQKTDQERVQNLSDKLIEWKYAVWEVTEKLDGTSVTFYLDNEGDFHVCSRNLDLRETEGNPYWEIANRYNIEFQMRSNGLYGVAIQGEMIGPGIQKNKYGLRTTDFYAFDVQVNHGDGPRFLPSEERQQIVNLLGLRHVPILATAVTPSIQTALFEAEGKSKLNPATEREGIVYKAVDASASFKAISNKFLLKTGE